MIVPSLKRNKSLNNEQPNQTTLTLTALHFFLESSKQIFINYFRLPPIIFKHQLYSLKPNDRTTIDFQLQEMFNRNEIRFFHSDYGIMLMMMRDYQMLIERQLDENQISSLSVQKERLKKRFISQFLPTCIRLSTDRDQLQKQLEFTDNEILLLIQAGLLLNKEIDQYWISIPNSGSFTKCLKRSRIALKKMLTRRTYREIPLEEFRVRDTKRSCPLGFDYHVYDLLGANLAHLIDTPTGSVVKIGSEKH